MALCTEGERSEFDAHSNSMSALVPTG